MKKIMFICALAVAACGGGTKTDSTTPDPSSTTSNTDTGSDGAGSAEPTAGEGTPCAQEIAMVCPDDQIDACLKDPPEGDTHTCVAK